MKKYFFGALAIIIIITSCIFLVYSRHNTLTITYIKFSVNPEFIIGVNSQNKIVRYNPLNEEAKMFNLLMFNEKSLQDATKIFITKILDTNYLNSDNSISITVMTKDDEKSLNLYNEISDVIKSYSDDTVINLIKPTGDELVSYSNETVYQMVPTYSKEELVSIGQGIYNQVNIYIENMINDLKIGKLTDEQKINLIKVSDNNGYFNGFDMSSIILEDYPIIISNRSSYEINFVYDDSNYTYNIDLNLEFDYRKNSINDKDNMIDEVYYYKLVNSKIIDYKNSFYQYKN